VRPALQGAFCREFARAKATGSQSASTTGTDITRANWVRGLEARQPRLRQSGQNGKEIGCCAEFVGEDVNLLEECVVLAGALLEAGTVPADTLGAVPGFWKSGRMRRKCRGDFR
jgi:hypothetical protein